MALFIARWRLRRAEAAASVPIREILIDTVRGRSVILLLGGLFIGYFIGPESFKATTLKPYRCLRNKRPSEPYELIGF